MNVPNQLTLLRFFLAIGYLGLMSWGSLWSQALALVVFIAAAITDFLDGTIARRMNLITSFGKLMDPLADKVLMMAAFVMMMEIHSLWIPGWAVVLILGREFLVTGLRTLAASEGAVLAALNSGKAKTVAQITFVITFSIIGLFMDVWRAGYLPPHIGVIAVEDAVRYTQFASLACFLGITTYTLHSGIEFTRANWHRLHLDEL